MLNVPLVVDQLKSFYHHAHVQALQGQFHDLEQHLASREQVTTLLARLPEPGSMIFDDSQDPEELDRARLSYTKWVGRLFNDYPDILEITYFNAEGIARFWLARSPSTGMLEPTPTQPSMPPEELLKQVFSVPVNTVFVSPIRLSNHPEDMRHVMTMRLAASITGENGKSLGAVVITIDVGGMARVSPATFWVEENGQYLLPGQRINEGNNAFKDFAGLEQIFAQKKLALWTDNGRQMFWIPMFHTESSGLLWVGRSVDPSPLNDFLSDIFFRVSALLLLLAAIIFIGARYVAKRLTRFSDTLKIGLKKALDGEKNVNFFWKGNKEIRQIGQDMTALAKRHSQNLRVLQQRSDELEASNRYKSEFLANASHELKTPLNSILLLSKLLNEKPLDLAETDKRQLAVIHSASVDLKNLVDNILDLSRIEAGKLGVNCERVKLADLLRSIADILQPQFDEKGIELVCDIRCSVNSVVETDSDKVAQIIKNFLSNALKFTDSGRVVLSLSKNASDSKRHYPIDISVTDSGIGIPEEKQQQIFQVFTQADGSTHRRYGGSGLGLSISQSLAQLIGGSIQLKSEVGKGATFSLLLPISSQDSSIGSEAQAFSPVFMRPEIIDVVPKDWSNHGGVLLVFFEISDLLGLTPLMEGDGLTVHAADNVDEALDALKDEDTLSVVIVDARRSAGDACDTIAKLQQENEAIEFVILHNQVQEMELSAIDASLFVDGDDKKYALVELVEQILSKE